MAKLLPLTERMAVVLFGVLGLQLRGDMPFVGVVAIYGCWVLITLRWVIERKQDDVRRPQDVINSSETTIPLIILVLHLFIPTTRDNIFVATIDPTLLLLLSAFFATGVFRRVFCPEVEVEVAPIGSDGCAEPIGDVQESKW
jgi:hypothetical protein